MEAELQTQAQIKRGNDMILKNMREDRNKQTGKASDIARITNYSLLAVCWIICDKSFKQINNCEFAIICLVISLSADYLQYLIKSIAIGIIYWKRENKNSKDNGGHIDDNAIVDDYPSRIRIITWIFYFIKFSFTIIAAFILLWNLIRQNIF